MSWTTARLADCCEIVSGATPSTSVDDYWEGDIRWATPKDLSNLDSHYISDTPRKLTSEGLQSCAASILPENSVLFSSRAPIGHVAINTVPMATNQGFKSFVPKSGVVDAKYIFHWLRANRGYLESLGNGATFKEVSKATVSRIEIPYPPLPEQRRIAAILDQADALRAKRREALAQLDSLTQAIFIEMFGDPKTLMDKGEVVQLSDVVAPSKIVTYGIVRAGPEVEGGVPYIRTGDIKNGLILEHQLARTSHDIANSYSRSALSVGDIVMSIRATVGTTAVVPSSLDGANLTQGTARISPRTGVSVQYLLNYLRTDSIQRWIQSHVKGATFREITLGKLRQLPVFIPSARLQDCFVERTGAVEQLKQRASDAGTELDALFASLQHRAFRGDL